MNEFIKKLRCKRCGKKWRPRRFKVVDGREVADSRRCPGCNSAIWDEPKRPRRRARREKPKPIQAVAVAT